MYINKCGKSSRLLLFFSTSVVTATRGNGSLSLCYVVDFMLYCLPKLLMTAVTTDSSHAVHTVLITLMMMAGCLHRSRNPKISAWIILWFNQPNLLLCMILLFASDELFLPPDRQGGSLPSPRHWRKEGPVLLRQEDGYVSIAVDWIII